MKLCTSEEMRLIDKEANSKIPSILLMENAARSVYETCFSIFNGKRIIIVCGKGNNGGDGLALARLLKNQNIKVFILEKEKLSQDAAINYNYLNLLKIPVEEIEIKNFETALENADIVFDALLGTGFTGEIKGIYTNVINAINTLGKYTISLDIPSGLNANTGEINNVAVVAKMTVTFCLPKIGLFLNKGAEYCGEIHVTDINIPQSFIPNLNINTLTNKEANALLPQRTLRSNKGTYGKVCCIAGCENMTGAAVFVCKSAYKTGAGLVYAWVVKAVEHIIHISVPEAVCQTMHEQDGKIALSPQMDISSLNKMNVVAIGSGLSQSQSVTEVVNYVLLNSEIPMVIDADGLNSITNDLNILEKVKAQVIITPHIGEMSRLTKYSIEHILLNTLAVALEFSIKHNVITVLKDAKTIIAFPNGQAYINTSGCAAMAKAGSGDVLTGIIAGLIAQGLKPEDAAVLGVYVHGLAGEAAAKSGKYGVMASDIIDNLKIEVPY